jgi:hypothetical protein
MGFHWNISEVYVKIGNLMMFNGLYGVIMNMQSNVCKAKVECGWGLSVNKVEMSYIPCWHSHEASM